MPPHPAAAAETEGGLTKNTLEIIKAVVGSLQPNLEGEKSNPRPGPLVVVGRFYLSMTVILATVTSVASIVDWKSAPYQASCIVETMRIGVLAVGLIGLLLGVLVLVVLLKRHTLYVFSPSELSPEAQQAMIAPISKEAAAASAIVPAPTQPPAPPGG